MVRKVLCVVVCLVLPLSLNGQSTPSSPVPPAFAATGSFFALSVADLDASTRWYSEKLGLQVSMQIPKQGRISVAVLEGSGLIVELIQNDDARPPSAVAPESGPELIHGVIKVGVIVEDFEKALDLLKARHVDVAFGPYPAKAGQRANVIIKDNAGNLIQLFGRY